MFLICSKYATFDTKYWWGMNRYIFGRVFDSKK